MKIFPFHRANGIRVLKRVSEVRAVRGTGKEYLQKELYLYGWWFDAY